MGRASKVRTRSTTTRDRSLQFRGSFSTGFLEFSRVDFCSFFSAFSVCNLVRNFPQNVENIAPFPGWRKSETGRIQFRRVRFQTPNSVSFLGLTEFRGVNSVSSSRPIICVPQRTHRVSRRTHRVCRKTQWGSVSSLLRNSTLETVFPPVS